MDNSILRKIPAEIRLQIYNNVFPRFGKRIVVNLHKDRPATHWTGFDKGLLLTCRDIYNEAVEIMWRNAIVYVESGDRTGAPVQELIEAIPERLVRNITFLVDAEVECSESSEHDAPPLPKLPNLEVVAFSADIHVHVMWINDQESCTYVRRLCRRRRPSRKIRVVPFRTEPRFGCENRIPKIVEGCVRLGAGRDVQILSMESLYGTSGNEMEEFAVCTIVLLLFIPNPIDFTTTGKLT